MYLQNLSSGYFPRAKEKLTKNIHQTAWTERRCKCYRTLFHVRVVTKITLAK